MDSDPGLDDRDSDDNYEVEEDDADDMEFNHENISHEDIEMMALFDAEVVGNLDDITVSDGSDPSIFFDARMPLFDLDDQPMEDVIGQENLAAHPLQLQPEDVLVCGGRISMHDPMYNHHPGNLCLREIAAQFTVPYGLATNDTVKQNILAEIQAQVHMTGDGRRGNPPRRFLVLEQQDPVYYRLANQEEITAEIKRSVKVHFTRRPSENDVLFGRGFRSREFDGNRRLRAFVDDHRHEYAMAGRAARRRLVDITREYVEVVGRGCFLLPFDQARPQEEGCIKAPIDKIKSKIAHQYREQRGPTQAQAQPDVEEPPAPVPIINCYAAEIMTPSVVHSKGTADSATVESLEIPDGSFVNQPTSEVRRMDGDGTSHPSFQQKILILKNFVTKRPRTTLGVALVVLVAMIAGIIVAVIVTSNKDSINMSTLQTVSEQGYLVCGVTNQVGYSTKDESLGYWVGFEVDVCRAIAAGIFGKDRFATLVDEDPFVISQKRSQEPVKYVALTPKERFRALKNKTVDVLLAVTSQTMERMVYEPETKSGYSFSTPYVVNEVVFAGNETDMDCLRSAILISQDSNSTLLGKECMDDKLSICVLAGSTHNYILTDIGLDPSKTNIVGTTDLDDFYNSFKRGDCNIIFGEKFDLSPQHLENKGHSTDEYVIGEDVLSQEFISVVTRDGDAEFSDFGNWIIQFLFSAEQGFMLEETDVFGDRYKTMFQDVRSVVGHYGEMYNQHLEPFVKRSPANSLNNGSSPLMFAIPFGNGMNDDPPSKTVGPTFKVIEEKQILRCGVHSSKNPFYAWLNEENKWEGFDVNFCQAIAASLFGGVYDGKVEFVQVDTADRFDKLRAGEVDVLVRSTTITFPRDAKKESGGVGLTFSFPNIYDTIKFVGLPDLVECAEKRYTTFGKCADLKFCVTKNTTQAELVARQFQGRPVHFSDSSADNVVALKEDLCNVLVSGSVDISIARTQDWFQEQGFVIGTKPWSRESLALVTRDDDPLWSKYVNWVVAATIYAEQHNITRDSALDMPTVNLFGPMVRDSMLRDLIGAVGSYGEIWKRNALEGMEREGRNQLAETGTDNLLRSDFWDIPM